MTEIKIEASIQRLELLLDAVEAGRIVLPDFQRDFDWSPTNVRSLLTTLLLGWPSGSLLFARHNPAHTEDLNPRPFETVGAIADSPDYVVLDGQQRLTSLLLALRERGDFRYALRYGIDLNSPSRDQVDEAIVYVPADRWTSKHSTPRMQFQSGLIPFPALRSPSHFFRWRELALLSQDDAAYERLTELYRLILARITEYKFPVTVISDDVPASTLAGIFEVTNRTGLKLGTFDLMVARISTREWSLRESWDEASDTSEHLTKWLGEDATALLQAISLVERGDVRQAAVLELTPEIIAQHWDTAVAAMERTITFLRDECGAPGPAYVPYGVMIPAIAALFMRESVNERLLKRWFFNTSLGLTYDAASNTRVVADYQRLRDASVEEELTIRVELLAEATRKSHGALWRGLVCAINLSSRSTDGEFFSDQKDVAPRSVFGRTETLDEGSASHLRALSYALFRTGKAAKSDRAALLQDELKRPGQLLPDELPSVADGAAAYEHFFRARAGMVASFLDGYLS